MQFDGILMRACIARLNQVAKGARLQRVVQVSPQSVSFEFWAGGTTHLVCSAEAEAACMFIAAGPPQRQEPPGQFVSLLRRHLIGARLLEASQSGWDRVARLDFRARTELGDETVLRLWIETMGKHSNLVLARPDARIIDAAKRVGRSRSRVRQILPGLVYQDPPPAPPKLAPDEIDPVLLASALGVRDGIPPTASPTLTGAALVRAIAGIGPERARQLLAHIRGPADSSTFAADGRPMEAVAAIAAALASLARRAAQGDLELAAETEMAFWPAIAAADQKQADQDSDDGQGDPSQPWSFGASPAQRSLHAAVLRTAARTAAEASATEAKLAAMPDPEVARREADAIMSSLPEVRARIAQVRQEGTKAFNVELPCYDAGAAGPQAAGLAPAPSTIAVEITADEDPVGQAQARYARYAAANRRRQALVRHIAVTQERQQALAVLAFQLEQDLTPEELHEVLTEAAGLGITTLQPTGHRQGQSTGGKQTGSYARKHRRDPVASQPRRATSPGGYEVLIGRNNHQNDTIVKLSRNDDLWFHARGVPGAHVLLRRAGRAEPVPAADIEYAAGLAAAHSQARLAGTVAVDYCPARQLRRERGAAPGFVTYSDETTVRVTPLELQV